jgi:hypothetical protein
MVFVLWRNLVKLIYVLLACALITMNSAFAAPIEEGSFGGNNKFFCLKKETVIEHFGSEEPRYSYGMVQPAKPLIIEGCEYNLWGFMRGAIGENLKTNPTIQWIVFENDTVSPKEPCEDWSYIWQPSRFDKDNGVTFELHTKPEKTILDATPVSSSN